MRGFYWQNTIAVVIASRGKGSTLVELSDDAALVKAAQGDQDAFGVLYERYVERIYTYVYYRTGNTFDAEDLTEKVFFRAMHHIGTYRNLGLPFSAWLYRIAHNLVANWHRDNSRRKEIPLDESIFGHERSDHPEFELLRSEEQERLFRVIRRLPPERQQLLILKFVEHLSNAEIGQIIGRTEGAVKSLYHRTLLVMRDELGEIHTGLKELPDSAKKGSHASDLEINTDGSEN